MPPLETTLYDASADRQALDRLATELRAVLWAFCDHQPLLRGSLRKLTRRCGKLRCRCARGQLHSATVFIDRQGEKPRIRKISAPEFRRLLVPTREYQKLRDRRARLVQIHRETLCLCDRLMQYRLAEGRRLHSSKRSP
jgi:hypothetical protein